MSKPKISPKEELNFIPPVTRKYFTVARVPGGWIRSICYVENGQIVKIEDNEPDLLKCASDHFKIDYVRYQNELCAQGWSDQK